MANSTRREQTRLEQVAETLSLAFTAISAGIVIYKEYKAMRRESGQIDALQEQLEDIQNELSMAKEARLLDAGTQENLTTKISDVRQKIRKKLIADRENNVEEKLRTAQNALQQLAGRPYPDSGTTSSQYPQSTQGDRNRYYASSPESSSSHHYSHSAERGFDPPPPPRGSGYYPPPPSSGHETNYPPHFSQRRPPPPNNQHRSGSGGYPRGGHGTRRPEYNNTHYEF